MASSVSTANKPPFNPSAWLTFGTTVMDRYIVSELIMPFLFGVVALSSGGVAIGVLFDLMRKMADAGLPATIAIQVLLLKLPYYITYSFPMSMLLACLIVYGRFSSDSELIAMRSCGVSVYRLVAPAIAMSLVVTGLTLAFNEAIVPMCNVQAEKVLNQALDKKEPNYRESDILYQEYHTEKKEDGDKVKRIGRLYYAKEYDGTRLKNVTILDFTQKGLNQILTSESAVLDADDKTWNFFNGTNYGVSPDGSYRNIFRFERYQLQLPRTPFDLANNDRDPGEMNMAQMREYLELIRQSGSRKEIRKLELRLDQKVALPLVCLAFGVIGSTLGVRSQRTARATSFGISLILIVGYHILFSVCEVLYFQGILTAFLGAWLPTLIALGAGILLLIQRNR